MVKRAVLYARVSSDDTRNNGRNLESQLEMCREYATQNGWRIVEELAEDDRGASGASIDLPQLNQILELAANGAIDVVVVREIDRFSRRLAKQLIVEEQLRQSGVEVAYVLGQYEDTPEGGLLKNVRAVIAEYERLKTTERTMRARRRLAKAGNVIVHCELAPYGYRLSEDKRSFVVYEPEAEIVRTVFRWYVDGDEEGRHLGYKAIASRLTDMRVPTCMDRGTQRWKQRGKGEWAPTSVGYILKNETYAGRWYYGRKSPNGANPQEHWIAVDVPPIISRELWDKAQEQRSINRARAKRNMKRQYLMQGRMRCGRCGSGISPKVWSGGGREYRNYKCAARLGYVAAKTCDLPTFRVSDVDEAVWNWVCSFLTDPSTLREALEECQQQQREALSRQHERLAVIDGLIEQHQLQLTRLLDLYLSGEFPKDILAERKGHLEKSIADLQAERSSLSGRLESSTLTKDQIKAVELFARSVSQGLERASDDFAARRRIIEELDVRATLDVKDGSPLCDAECLVGKEMLSIGDSTSPTTDWPASATGRWCSG